MHINNVKRNVISLIRRFDGSLYRHQGNKSLYNHLKADLEQIPESNGSKVFKKIPIHVGIIADEFVFENFVDTCNLHYLSRNEWEDIIIDIQALIVTTTWHGIDNSWTGIYRNDSQAYNEYVRLCKKVRELDIPIAFYSKEDPPNFDLFLSLALYADVIFTSSIECVDKYKVVYGSKPCYPLSFGVNPILHNPIRKSNKIYENCVLFAGSHMKKYPNRTLEEERLFSTIISNGLNLTIIDRNYNRNNRTYYFPREYRRMVVGNFSYREIAKIYKLFPYVLNLNSVSESETMFASRIYDALACGSVLISSESIGMKQIFPFIAVSDEEIDKLFEITDIHNLRKHAIRNVLREKTTFDIMQEILCILGFDVPAFKRPDVDILVSKVTDNIIQKLNNQSYKNIHICKRNNESTSECSISMDDNVEFDSYMIEDMVDAFMYTDSDFISVSKNDHFQYTNKILEECRTMRWKISETKCNLIKSPLKGFQI